MDPFRYKHIKPVESNEEIIAIDQEISSVFNDFRTACIFMIDKLCLFFKYNLTFTNFKTPDGVKCGLFQSEIEVDAVFRIIGNCEWIDKMLFHTWTDVAYIKIIFLNSISVLKKFHMAVKIMKASENIGIFNLKSIFPGYKDSCGFHYFFKFQERCMGCPVRIIETVHAEVPVIGDITEVTSVPIEDIAIFIGGNLCMINPFPDTAAHQSWVFIECIPVFLQVS